jgi:hypothetical protein
MNLLIDEKKKDEALKFCPKLNSELMKIAKTGNIKNKTLLEMFLGSQRRFLQSKR